MPGPFGFRRLLIGLGAGIEPKTIEGAGTTGQVLRIATTGDEPTWGSLNLAGAGVTGDLPYANLTQGAPLSVLGVAGNSTADVASIQAAVDGNVLRRFGTSLDFGRIVTDAITDAAVTYIKMQGVSAASRLLGRRSTGAGDVEEITLASGLTMSGTALTPMARAIMQFWNTIAVPVATTTYLGRGDGAQGSVRFNPGVTGNVVALYTIADANVGVGQTWTYTFNSDTVDTAITHQVAGAGGFTGSSTGSVGCAPGTQFAIKLVTSAAAAVANHMCTLVIEVTG